MALKAYSFSEVEHLDSGVHDKAILEQEKLLAAAFVRDNPCLDSPDSCPLCESADSEPFAVIGGAQYHRCKNCWSLFVSVSEEVMQRYKNYEAMNNFRKSTKYQEIAVQKRTDVWSELLFWIEFRATRYFRPLKELSVIEIGERHEGFSERVKSSCQKHSAYRKAIDVCDFCDAVLYLGTIIGERSPTEALKAIHKHINKDGLLFLSSRVSTGFDILTLKGNIGSIYPYEVVTIPSIEALQSILKKTGFEVLEISTPGMLDMHYVVESRSKLESGDLFTKYLAEKTDKSARSEFQRLLQKNAMSSHAQFVARVCHE